METKVLYAGLLGIALAMPAAADEALVAWVERAQEASQRANYSGTLALMRGEKLRVLEVRQGFDGERRMRYLRSVSGPQIEFLRLGTASRVVYPTHKLVIQGVGAGGPAGAVLARLDESMQHVPEHYELHDQGVEQVAGRNCRHVRFMPRDHYRYGCDLCVDQLSGLLLQARVLSPEGEMLEQFSFTSMELHEAFSDFSSESFKLRTDMRGFARKQLPHDAQPASAQWQVQEMPPGFAVRQTMARKRGEDEQPMLHMVVSDALSRVSVFIEGVPVHLPISRAREHFIRHAHHGYMTTRDGYLITVVGNAPFETVRMIADSLRRNP